MSETTNNWSTSHYNVMRTDPDNFKVRIRSICINAQKHHKSAKLPWRHNIKLSFCSFGLFLFLSCCVFVFLSFSNFCLFAFLSFCIFVLLPFLSFCHVVFLSLCNFWIFVFLSRHHADQMSEGSQISKVTLCVKIQKWHWPLWLTGWPRVGLELTRQQKTIIGRWEKL